MTKSEAAPNQAAQNAPASRDNDIRVDTTIDVDSEQNQQQTPEYFSVLRGPGGQA